MFTDIISKAIICTLPSTVAPEEFENFVARKAEVYPLYDSAILLQSDGSYRVGVFGEGDHVREVLKGITDKVGGWGGRVEEEVVEPRFSPARRLGR